MKEKLELVKKLQKKYNDLYLGGSLGLLIHGISLGRDIGDIDFTKKSDEGLKPEHLKLPTSVNSSDMIYAFEEDGIKVEIGTDPNVSYTDEWYEGYFYKVSSIEHILGKKMKYALQGEEKHINDIKHLLSKIEVKEPISFIDFNSDEPF